MAATYLVWQAAGIALFISTIARVDIYHLKQHQRAANNVARLRQRSGASYQHNHQRSIAQWRGSYCGVCRYL